MHSDLTKLTLDLTRVDEIRQQIPVLEQKRGDVYTPAKLLD